MLSLKRALFVTFLSTVVPAAVQAVSPVPVNEDGEVEDPKVCKRVETVGSRIPKKICLLQSEWQRAEDDAARAVDRLRNQSVEKLEPGT